MYNGAAYFIALIIFNVAHLTLTLLSYDTPLTQASQVNTLKDPVTGILTCRLLLALQSANVEALNTSSPSASSADAGANDTLRFASRLIGSIGSSLPVPPTHTHLLDIEDEVNECTKETSEGSETEQVLETHGEPFALSGIW
ncbi:hypothetical protein OH77DRAFT_943762 [Trametes cingulata]|nr:hypothetical protein OH77DRAFT_943762 [Trametes cingulata]